MSADTSPPPASSDRSRPRWSDASPPATMTTAGANHELWWIRLLLGLVAAAVGVMVLAWPEATVTVVAVLFGVNLLIDGGMRVLQAILTPSANAVARVLVALLGAVSVVIGVLCLQNLLQTVAVLTVLIGVSWLLGGIFELIAALSSGPPSTWGSGTALDLATGVVALVGGVVVLAYPKITLGTLIVLLGVSMLVSGAMSVINAIRWRAHPST